MKNIRDAADKDPLERLTKPVLIERLNLWGEKLGRIETELDSSYTANEDLRKRLDEVTHNLMALELDNARLKGYIDRVIEEQNIIESRTRDIAQGKWVNEEVRIDREGPKELHSAYQSKGENL